MRCGQLARTASFSKTLVACAAACVMAVMHTGASAEDLGQASVGRVQAGARPGTAFSPRMAMLDGEVIYDGNMMMDDGSAYGEPCQSCRNPPWHGNVASPYQCGPVCDPCAQPHRQSCFPRLSALFSQGQIVSPIPPCNPRCQHCGAHVPIGF